MIRRFRRGYLRMIILMQAAGATGSVGDGIIAILPNALGATGFDRHGTFGTMIRRGLIVHETARHTAIAKGRGPGQEQ